MIVTIKELLDEGRLGKVISARFDVGSYVPEWHKYEDFRAFLNKINMLSNQKAVLVKNG